MPHHGPRAPGTQALCTMSQLTPDIFPLEQLPAPQERVRWTYPWTHKPVHPAEVLSALLFPAETVLCWFLPLQGRGAECSFLCPLLSRSSPEMEFPTSSRAGRKAAHPPVSQSGIVGGIGGLPFRPCPASPWSGLGPLDVLPWNIISPLCLCACVCTCPL